MGVESHPQIDGTRNVRLLERRVGIGEVDELQSRSRRLRRRLFDGLGHPPGVIGEVRAAVRDERRVPELGRHLGDGEGGEPRRGDLHDVARGSTSVLAALDEPLLEALGGGVAEAAFADDEDLALDGRHLKIRKEGRGDVTISRMEKCEQGISGGQLSP